MSGRVSLALGVAIGAALVVALVLAVTPARDAVAAVVAPNTVATRPAVDAQVVAAERAVQRGYAKARGQLTQVRKLTLAISGAQADATQAKAQADLDRIRHDALQEIARIDGIAGAQAEAYVAAVARDLDRADVSSEGGVLLAPQLYEVTRRADELFVRTADRATRELTGTGQPTPSPSPTGR